MPDTIQVEEQELNQIVQVINRIRAIHLQLGALSERKYNFLGILEKLRREEKTWEDVISEKYHLPGGVDWKIDTSTGAIVMPPSDGDQEERTSEEAQETESPEE